MIVTEECLRRVEMIEHPIDDDTGDGDVEPKGERPACDGFVAIELFTESAAEGHEYKRDDGDGENDMGDEDEEVDGAHPTLAGEFCGAVTVVIDEVTDQEND